jgi:cell division protein FtsA
MASSEIIAGLDIGTTRVCAIIGEFNERDELEILGVGVSPSLGLRKGVVINIEATQKSVLEAIEQAEQMAGREVDSVIASIAGPHIEGINSRGVVAVNSRGREITQSDVDRVMEAARAVVLPMDREIIHLLPQEYLVDEQRGCQGSPGYDRGPPRGGGASDHRLHHRRPESYKVHQPRGIQSRGVDV